MFKPYYTLLFRRLSFVLSALLLLTVACNDDDPQEPEEVFSVKLTNNATFGNILADGQGNTLYYFTRDVTGTSACSGNCSAVWPTFYSADLTVGEDLKAEDFANITRADGSLQTTYRGWPLYYHAPLVNGQNVREKPGETLGDQVANKTWFVVKPNYTVMIATTSVLDKSTNQTATQNFLVDPQGRTLYIFERDNRLPTTLPTNCTGGCINAWPVFYQANLVLPSSLKASDFGAITRNDGPNGTTRQHTTYKGLPIYYYTPDGTTRGKVEGHGVKTGQDPWYVANP
jgi:predicted lipoprotein with Yx(FWY)xxD motif